MENNFLHDLVGSSVVSLLIINLINPSKPTSEPTKSQKYYSSSFFPKCKLTVIIFVHRDF